MNENIMPTTYVEEVFRSSAQFAVMFSCHEFRKAIYFHHYLRSGHDINSTQTEGNRNRMHTLVLLTQWITPVDKYMSNQVPAYDFEVGPTF